MILAVCYALDLSVSFEPIFVDFAILFDMLALLQFSYCHRRVCVFIYYFAHGTNTLNFFSVSKTL